MNKKLFEYSYTLRKQKQSKDLKIFAAIICAIVIITIIMNLLIYPVIQNSDSMDPDVPANSSLLITPIVKNPARGDIVIIKSPNDNDIGIFKKIANVFVVFFTARKINLAENNSFPNTKSRIRRVVGMPGDTIYMKDYKLYIKPSGEKHFLTEYELIDKSYNINYGNPPENWDHDLGVSGNFEEMVIGTSEYFLLSDNRNSAEDSRIWGPVHKNQISGKVLLCFFPFNKAKFLF